MNVLGCHGGLSSVTVAESFILAQQRLNECLCLHFSTFPELETWTRIRIQSQNEGLLRDLTCLDPGA